MRFSSLMARAGALLALTSCVVLIGATNAGAVPASFSGTSVDGEAVFFMTSEQLVPGDTDTRIDVYERAYDDSLERYVTRLVSAGPIGGNDAFTALYDGSSVDGSRVFFSTEERLVVEDTDHSEDVYMRDLELNTTTLVSQGDSACGACGNGEIDAGFAPGGVIPNGERVFFVSVEKLALEDIDSSVDVYRRDLGAGTTVLASRGDSGCAGGGCGNGSFSATFRGASADGSKAFITTTEGLVGGDGDGLLDVYQRNLTTGATSLVSVSGTCPPGLDCSAVYGGASSNGSHVYFETNERLSAGDEDGSQDVYVWSGGTASLVSTGPDGGNGASASTFAGAASDGSEVLFETGEGLVAADDDESQDLYGRGGGVTRLVSTGPADGSAGLPASFRWVSPDGSSAAVVFNTAESMVSGDTDASQDVYARNGSTTTLLSTGPAGGDGELNANFAGASSDGSHIFVITPEALVAADTDVSADVYEIASGATTLVSTGPVGGKGAISAGLPAGGVSQDGSHSFFITEERLTVDDLDAETDVYDRFAGGTLLVSVGNAAPLGPPTPAGLSTDPASPGETLTPRVKGQADPNTSIKLYATSDCSGAPIATGTSAELGGAGIEVTVVAGSTTSFRATATDSNGDISPCSTAVSYTQQSAEPPPPPPPPDPGSGGSSGGESSGGTKSKPGGGASKGGGAAHLTPRTRITFAPAGVTRARRPVFRFTDSTEQEGTTFRCKVDAKRWGACSSPVKVKKLAPGKHTFLVRATNAVGTPEPTPVKRKFKVVGR